MSEAARPGGTYQTLDEQREKLSPAEERFERFRQTIGLFLGPIVFLAMYFIPLPLAPAQPPFSLLEVLADGAVVGPASAGGCGTGATQAQLLAAVAFEDDTAWLPLIGPAKWLLVYLVVSFDSYPHLRHLLNPSCPSTRP